MIASTRRHKPRRVQRSGANTKRPSKKRFGIRKSANEDGSGNDAVVDNALKKAGETRHLLDAWR
jgi:hypothetical protein